MRYSDLQLTLDKRYVTFQMCITEAFKSGMAKEVDRLFGTRINRALKAHGITKMVDEATGFAKDQYLKFIAFVWECVWKRLDPRIRITNPYFEFYLQNTYQPIWNELTKDTS